MKSPASDLVAICRMFGVFEREAVCCGTVTMQQCVVLQDLLTAPSDVSGLADGAGVSLSAMTRLVDGLERRGWVVRERDVEDRRRVFVSLSKAGAAEARRLAGLTEIAVEAVLSRVPAKKRSSCVEAIRLLRQAVVDAREDIASCCE